MYTLSCTQSIAVLCTQCDDVQLHVSAVSYVAYRPYIVTEEWMANDLKWVFASSVLSPNTNTKFACRLNSIVSRGSLPRNFLYSVIIPIPKSHNAIACDSCKFWLPWNCCDVNFSNISDDLVLSEFSDKLPTSNLQFGFCLISKWNKYNMKQNVTFAHFVFAVYCNTTNVMQCTPYTHRIEKSGAPLARSGSVSDRKSLHTIH